MSRPAPKKSALAGLSPTAPPQPAPTPSSSQPERREEETVPAAPKPKAPRPKTAFYQDAEDAARMRAAYLHTLADEGYSSLSAFIAQAVIEKVERLESKYNAGQSWPEVGPGTVPAGRPVGR